MIVNELKIMIEISEGFGGKGANYLMNMVRRRRRRRRGGGRGEGGVGGWAEEREEI